MRGARRSETDSAASVGEPGTTEIGKRAFGGELKTALSRTCCPVQRWGYCNGIFSIWLPFLFGNFVAFVSTALVARTECP